MIVTTVAIVVAGLPSLWWLKLNFDPLALERQTSPPWFRSTGRQGNTVEDGEGLGAAR